VIHHCERMRVSFTSGSVPSESAAIGLEKAPSGAAGETLSPARRPDYPILCVAQTRLKTTDLLIIVNLCAAACGSFQQ